MSEETNEVEVELDEGTDGGYDRSRQRINLGIHPLGGILLDVVDAYGNHAAIQMDQQMLAQIVLTLITMNVMMTTQDAQQRAQAEAQLAKDLWTPNG